MGRTLLPSSGSQCVPSRVATPTGGICVVERVTEYATTSLITALSGFTIDAPCEGSGLTSYTVNLARRTPSHSPMVSKRCSTPPSTSRNT